MMFSSRKTGWPAALFGLVGVCSGAGADTVVVCDASNSMWGQIDGEAKVTIARRDRPHAGACGVGGSTSVPDVACAVIDAARAE